MSRSTRVAALRREGIEALGDNGKDGYRVTCSRPQCELFEDRQYRSVPSPDMVVKHFKRNGWTLAGKPVCPTCNGFKKPTAEPVVEEGDKDMPVANINPKLMRTVFGTIEENFDEVAMRYHSGWSDERVAKILGMAPDFVVGIRREAFGELAEDPETAELKESLDNAHRDLNALEVLLRDELDKFGNTIKLLQERIDRLKKGDK